MAMGGKFAARSMPFRFLGNSGLKVSALSYGTWVTVHGQMGLDITKACMKEAWDLGCNYFDTAEVYQAGECEKIVGQALKELEWPRSDYVISTKIFWGGGGPNDMGLSRKHVKEAMAKCLSRLQLDYVDMIMAHRPDPWTPMEEVVRAYTDLIREGKALYWGTSEWSAFDIEHAHHMATKHNLIAPIADQPEYNAFRRDRVEADLLPLYKLYHYGLTTFSPLASGLLTGKYANGIPEGSRFSMDAKARAANGLPDFDNEDTRTKIAKVQKLAELTPSLGESVTLGQMMLAWILKNPNVSTVITGASKPEQIRENFKAIKLLPKLEEAFMEKIEKILGNKPEGLQSFGRWT